MNNTATMFDDLEADLGKEPTNQNTVAGALAVAGLAKPASFTETCPKCKGSGKFTSYAGRVIGSCFNCKGAGQLTFKTDAKTRAAAAGAAAIRKRKQEIAKQEEVASYREANPAVAEWIDRKAPYSSFAASLQQALAKFGSLTDNQTQAVLRSVAKDAEKVKEIVAAAPEINCATIEKAFESALSNNIKNPKLRLGSFTFKPAKSTGRNPGAIYVTETGNKAYLGKVVNGKFFGVASCDEVRKSDIIATAADPHNAAKAYGLKTGSCSCCGRTLTDPVSIEKGIGPICEENFGWGG